jgi:hypothetical protein
MKQHREREPNIETIMQGFLDEILNHINKGNEQFFLKEFAKIVIEIDKYFGKINSQYESVKRETQSLYEFNSAMYGKCQTLCDRTGILMDPGTTIFNNLINRIMELPSSDRKTFIRSIIDRINPESKNTSNKK